MPADTLLRIDKIFMFIFLPRIPKPQTISECVKTAAVHPPNIAEKMELEASITDEKIAP